MSSKRKLNKEVEHMDTDEEVDSGDEGKKPTRTLTATMLQEEGDKMHDNSAPYNSNPTSIEDLGYTFKDRNLVNIKTGGKFKFLDQKHYELLGDFIVPAIQKIMVQQYHMKEDWVPRGAEHGEKRTNIFYSQDFFTNKDKLMVLICGSGAVKAGQWARSLCINDSLQTGSLLPYLEDAHTQGYATIVLNPNTYVPGADGPEKHGTYVWENYIKDSPARDIVIVAHSYGGIVTINLLNSLGDDILKRLRGIAFTDSVHSLGRRTLVSTLKAFLEKNSCNWVQSKSELDTIVEKKSESQGCKCVSAGVNIHEHTSEACRESVFPFLAKCIRGGESEEEITKLQTLKFLKPAYGDVLGKDDDVYPTPYKVTLQGISNWYTNNPEFAFEVYTAGHPVGSCVVIPLHERAWQEMKAGHLRECDVNSSHIFDINTTNHLYLHFYHIEKFDPNFTLPIWKVALWHINNITNHLKSQRPTLEVRGVSGFCVSAGGVALFQNKWECSESGYISKEYVCSSDSGVVVVEADIPPPEYTQTQRCRFLCTERESGPTSIVWRYLGAP